MGLHARRPGNVTSGPGNSVGTGVTRGDVGARVGGPTGHVGVTRSVMTGAVAGEGGARVAGALVAVGGRSITRLPASIVPPPEGESMKNEIVFRLLDQPLLKFENAVLID